MLLHQLLLPLHLLLLLLHLLLLLLQLLPRSGQLRILQLRLKLNEKIPSITNEMDRSIYTCC